MSAEILDRIVNAKIHSAIGIARVGDSEACFIGPESVDPPPAEPGARRDA
jgi:hypothetical protein